MAKASVNKKPIGTKPGTKKTGTGVTVEQYNIHIRSIDRTGKDIADYNNLLRSAENSPMETNYGLVDLMHDVERDPVLSSLIDKRCMAVTNTKLRCVKAGKDVEQIHPIIRSWEFKKMLREIVMSRFYGTTLIESYFKPKFDFFSVPRKHIRPHAGIIAYEQYSNDGFSYREGLFLNTMMELGDPGEFGLLIKAIPYVIYKRGCMGDWAQYAEIFGMPTRVGKYNGYDEATRIALKKALDEAGAALSIIIPEGASLDLKYPTTTSGSSDLYKELKNACDEQLSILLLGQTETTKSSQSSGYAQSKVHAGTEDEINADDRAYVIAVLESKWSQIAQYHGLPMDGVEWVWDFGHEALSLKDRIDIDLKLVELGLPIEQAYFYNTYGIPMPERTDSLVKSKQPADQKQKVNLSIDPRFFS